MRQSATTEAGAVQADTTQTHTRLVRGWTLGRYLLAVALATLLALGTLVWARPSMLTGIVMAAGLGHRVQAAQPASFYVKRVAPIMEEQCAGCHGPRLQRARLRVDTLGDLKLGGKSGPVVIAGDAQASELYRRLLLPKTDKRAMPAGSKPPLSKDEIRTIELWIASGADGQVAETAIKNAPPPPSPPIVFAKIDPAAAARARAPLAEAVRELSTRYPGALSYQARDSAQIAFNAKHLGKAFGDADLARLGVLAPKLVRLDLTGTTVSDAGAPSLAALTGLINLRLDNTSVGDPLLGSMDQMQQLKTVSLIGTQATPQRMAQLRKRGVRVHGGD